MMIVCTMPVWDESKFVVWAEGPPGLEVERNKVEPTAAILGNQIRPRKGSENLRGGGEVVFSTKSHKFGSVSTAEHETVPQSGFKANLQ